MYTYEQLVTIQSNMINYGGGFVKHLGQALLHADHSNKQKLVKAFPEYMENYLNFGKPNKPGKDGSEN